MLPNFSRSRFNFHFSSPSEKWQHSSIQPRTFVGQGFEYAAKPVSISAAFRIWQHSGGSTQQ
jgi:hypothetical protein